MLRLYGFTAVTLWSYCYRVVDDALRCHSSPLELLPLLLRHHTNPVGTEWRWKMDQPEVILKEAIENHQSMIKQFKGIYLPSTKEC